MAIVIHNHPFRFPCALRYSPLMRRPLRLFWHTVLGVNVLVIAWFWWSGSGDLLAQGLPSVLVALGRLAGLGAAFILLLQFFTLGRLPWLERAFGLDRLSRFHHVTGILAMVFILAHPVLLTAGYAGSNGIAFVPQFLGFLGHDDILQAAIGIVLFILIIVTSVVIVRRRLRYEHWYLVHLLAYVALFLAFAHQMELGTDLQQLAFRGYWLFLYTAVLGSQILFRFARPVALFFRHRFTVERVLSETPGVTSVIIVGMRLQDFAVRPGQFMILRFLARGFWWEAHPFSLSRAPDGASLRVTVKALGDFTRRIPSIPPGAPVVIDGPYGTFTKEAAAPSTKVLFIAGGIGITPIRSLLEEMAGEGRDCVLLYANRTEADIVFRGELERIAAGKNVRIVHVLSEDPISAMEHGRLDAEGIKRLAPDVADRDVYLCGPAPMLRSLLPALRALGVPGRRLHYEKFALG